MLSYTKIVKLNYGYKQLAIHLYLKNKPSLGLIYKSVLEHNVVGSINMHSLDYHKNHIHNEKSLPKPLTK
jgi:hypothetical protein